MGLRVLEVLNHRDLRPTINSTLYLCNGKSCYQQNVRNIHIHFTKTHLLSIVIYYSRKMTGNAVCLQQTLIAIAYMYIEIYFFLFSYIFFFFFVFLREEFFFSFGIYNNESMRGSRRERERGSDRILSSLIII